VVAALVLVGFVAGIVQYATDDESTPVTLPVTVPATTTARPVTVAYTITGTTPVAILTMDTPTGSSQIVVDVPHVEHFQFPADIVVTIVAQSQSNGTITCDISTPAGSLANNQSSGNFTGVTCTAQVR
jgi:hypothetical protein